MKEWHNIVMKNYQYPNGQYYFILRNKCPTLFDFFNKLYTIFHYLFYTINNIVQYQLLCDIIDRLGAVLDQKRIMN